MRPTCPICAGRDSHAYQSRFAVPLRTCRNCSARYVHPIPPRLQLRARYEREHLSGKWDVLLDQGPTEEPARRAELLRRLQQCGQDGEPPRGRLLDIGFGDGRFLDGAADAGWSCVGIEISHAAAKGVTGRHPVAVASLDAIVDTPTLDAVTFWDVLEHLAEPAAAVRKAARRLRAGGLLAASMPSLSSVTARVEGPGWRYYDLDTYGHLVHMSPRHLRLLFEAEGLRIVHLETRGSVDLRHSLWVGRPSQKGIVGAVLDRLSGLVARLFAPRGYGNTILIVGQREAAPSGSGPGAAPGRRAGGTTR